MLASDTGALQQAKLVLLGDMGAGKSSLVLRFVKGQFFDYQVDFACRWSHLPSLTALFQAISFSAHHHFQKQSVALSRTLRCVQESTIGAAFLTKTMPEHNVKFEIWCVAPVFTFAQPQKPLGRGLAHPVG